MALGPMPCVFWTTLSEISSVCACVCVDVNECEEGGGEEGEGELLCEEGKYCFNTQGSYRCNGRCNVAYVEM